MLRVAHTGSDSLDVSKARFATGVYLWGCLWTVWMSIQRFYPYGPKAAEVRVSRCEHLMLARLPVHLCTPTLPLQQQSARETETDAGKATGGCQENMKHRVWGLKIQETRAGAVALPARTKGGRGVSTSAHVSLPLACADTYTPPAVRSRKQREELRPPDPRRDPQPVILPKGPGLHTPHAKASTLMRSLLHQARTSLPP